MRCESCREFLDLEGARFCPTCGATIPEPPPDPLIGQLVGGRYRIKSLVAEGGMGRVYAAEQSMGETSRKVAIKVLLAEYSGRELDMQRFMRECSTVAELEHPNTIKFYDYGETNDGDLFIAMEFLAGQSLSQALKGGAMAPERVDLIVGQICGSLQEAHDHGIVHRDLKPDNIILTSPGGQPDFVKVLDFGIAKRVGRQDPKLTPLGVVLGSPPYMSPEQFTLQDIDARSDIYSLGVLAFQALTGKLPFQARDPLEWAHLHMNTEPLSFDATESGPFVPDSMRRAVLRALAKDPANRPQSAREFFGELTLGSGTLPPGRLPSLLPLSHDLVSMVSHASVAPSGHVSQRPMSSLPRPQSSPPRGTSPAPSRSPSAPPARSPSGAPGRSPSSPPVASSVLGRRPSERPSAAEGPSSDEAPTYVRHVDAPSLAISDLSVSELRRSELDAIHRIADEGSAVEPRVGKQGTVVMAGSDPPPDPLAGSLSIPERPRLTMPDLLPPTVRDANALLDLQSKRNKKKYAIAAGLLVAIGAVAGLLIWLLGFRPSGDSGSPTSPSRRATRQNIEGPTTHVDVPTSRPATSGAPIPAPSASTAPTPEGKPELSPCQTAIFSAVSGNCEVAKRSFARCQPESPYQPSAARAMSGLCP
jgi:serine/threonine protein kinase